MYAGLGDIAVPGLLACLALRYDASRAPNMRARADAAAQALTGAFSQMEVTLFKPLASLLRLNVFFVSICGDMLDLAGGQLQGETGEPGNIRKEDNVSSRGFCNDPSFHQATCLSSLMLADLKLRFPFPLTWAGQVAARAGNMLSLAFGGKTCAWQLMHPMSAAEKALYDCFDKTPSQCLDATAVER